ncbi:MAG TPA: AAA family ATPase, partial [Lentzea sp.]|nr:AAA family ATPase [Lentzea sp.]
MLERAGIGKAAPPASPFPGLKAFDEDQASIFFGREEDVRKLAAPLLGLREFGSVAVIGPSGAGKSSLVRAGLIPLLRAEGWTIIGPITPSQGVLPVIHGPGRRLVVLDQAEEVLAGDSTELVRRLVTASRNDAWVVYTVRADFLDELMRREDFSPLFRDPFFVTPMPKADLPMVVNGPLRLMGWSVEDAALGLIQEDASGKSLPLLAFALENLWRHVNPDGKGAPRPITQAEYVQYGRVEDVLRSQADEAFAIARDLVRGEDGSWPPVREAERRVFLALRRLVAVDQSGKFTRRAVAVADLSVAERQLLDPFVTNRVLTATQHSLEVAHESLFVLWPRLRDALEQDRDLLRTRQEIEDIAAEWTKHPDQLIAPSRLASVVAAFSPADDTAAALWPRFEKALLKAHFSNNAVRLIGLSLQQSIDDEVRRVDDLEPDEVLRTLASDDPATRVLLHAPDLSGWQRSLSHAMASTLRMLSFRAEGAYGVAWSHEDTMLAIGAGDSTVHLHDASTGARMRSLTCGHEPGAGKARSVAWSPDGNLVACVSADATLRIWFFDTAYECRKVQLPAGPRSVRFSNDSKRILVVCEDGSAYLCSADGLPGKPRDIFSSVDHAGRPVRVRDADLATDFIDDFEWVALARDDGVVDVKAITGPDQGVKQHPIGPEIRVVRLHPNEPEVFATAHQDSSAMIFSEGRQTTLTGHSDQINAVAWSPNGMRLATASADGTVRIWDAVTAQELLCLHVGRKSVQDVAWSRNGDRIATVADGGSCQVWKVGSEPDLHWTWTQGEVHALTWSPLDGALSIGQTRGPSDPPDTWLLDVNHGDPRFNYETETLAWSPDGKRQVTGGVGGAVVLGRGERKIANLDLSPHGIHDAHWSHDSMLLAVVGRDRTWLPRVYDRDGVPL